MTSDIGPLRRHGFDASELDLRQFVAREDDLAAALADFPFVWVRGGNTFVLRAQLARSGADTVLADRLSDDSLVYAGYSAGACVLAPSLAGLEHTDDPGEVEPTCGVEPIWEGMGLIDHQIVVHVASPTDPHRDSARMTERYRAEATPYWALADDDVAVIDGEAVEILR